MWRRWSRRAALASVLALVWSSLTVAGGAASASARVPIRHRAARATVLSVVVADLPRATPANVTITGPDRFRRRLSKSATLKGLRPGTYELAATPVRVASGTYYPLAKRRRLALHRGHHAKVVADYATLVPQTTRPVSTSATSSISGSPTGRRRLVLQSSAASGVKVGDILASGSTRAAPEGYLVKVVSVERSGNGQVVLEVAPATLMEALPQGELDVSEHLGPAPLLASLRDTLRSHLSRAHYSKSFSNKYFTCTTSASFSITPSFSVNPSVTLKVKWGFFSIQSASFSATLTETASIDASGDAGATCTTKSQDGLTLLSDVPLGKIPFDVAGIPGVIDASLSLYLTGSATVGAKLDASVGQTAKASAGVDYVNGQFKPFASFSNSFSQSFDATGNASADAYLVPTVSLLVDGLAGPTVDVGAGLQLSADTTKNPWWEVDGCLEAGAGFKIQVLGYKKSWSKSDIVSTCKPLLTANGGFPVPTSTGATPTTSTSAPTPTPTPTPTPAPAPTVTGLSPTSGPTTGGRSVTITGTGFSTAIGATTFTFGSDGQATSLNCSSSTSCSATSPAGAVGSVDVTAGVGGSVSSPSPPGDQFTYFVDPWAIQAGADPNQEVGAISCPSTTFCTAVDGSGNVLTWNGSTWSSPQAIDTTSVAGNGIYDEDSLISVSCPSSTFCAAVDDANGYAFTWNGSVWSAAQQVDPNQGLVSVSCSSPTFCVAVDLAGSAVTWDGSTWSTPASIDPGAELSSVSCTGPTFCVAVDYSGNALTWNGSVWSAPVSIDPGQGLYSLSCPSTTFCVAGDNSGNALTWNGSSWSAPVSIDPGQAVSSVSCTSASFCAAVDYSGNGLTWNGSSWSTAQLVDPYGAPDDTEGSYFSLVSVSCPTASFCGAVDFAGNALFYSGG